CMQGFQSPWTF
nr:immunoglobulin light chain junction region [Macaca mulatta]